MAAHLGMIVVLITCLSLGNSLPLSTSKSILIEPDTVRLYASFIHSSATVTSNTIQFGSGTTTGEQLLRVPVAAPGELDSQAVIRVTVGMNPPVADNDPAVGIANNDGSKRNQFWLVEHGTTTSTVNPCEVVSGSHNGRTATHGDLVAGTYVMLFYPYRRFGSCSTNTGFATAGNFNTFIDPSQGLSLVVNRDNSVERYTFHYFLVEVL